MPWGANHGGAVGDTDLSKSQGSLFPFKDASLSFRIGSCEGALSTSCLQFHPFSDFPNIFLIPEILSVKSFGNSWRNSYAIFSLSHVSSPVYSWPIKPVLKLCTLSRLIVIRPTPIQLSLKEYRSKVLRPAFYLNFLWRSEYVQQMQFLMCKFPYHQSN